MAAPRLLVVEDEWIIALDLKRALEDLGYEVAAVAHTASEAVKQALDHRPDLILMDIRLKGPEDGIETAAKVRARLDVPIVYLTGNTDPETMARAEKQGARGYVAKPFALAALGETIKRALG